MEYTTADIHREMKVCTIQLDESLAFLKKSIHDYADKERVYRLAKAQEYIRTSGTVRDREAVVDIKVADMMHAYHLAEGMKVAALEAVRSRRSQLSALQSIAAGYRAEADYHRTGPRVT